MAAMARPQSWRMGRELLVAIVLLDKYVFFMVFVAWVVLKKVVGFWVGMLLSLVRSMRG
jgi:hypothetical protein